jgi:hypothetical protein
MGDVSRNFGGTKRTFSDGRYNRLAGRFTVVEADVESIGGEFSLQIVSNFGDKPSNGRSFVGRAVEQTGYVSSRDHQGMPRGDGETASTAFSVYRS